MDSVVAVTLEHELEAFARSARRMKQIAVDELAEQKSGQRSGRMEFANTLLRHAKGCEVAATAWRNDLKHGR